MSYSGEFEGRIVVDGTVRSHGVAVWMSDVNLSLKEPGRSRFDVIFNPFNVSMILTQQRARMEEGLYFDFKGHRLGGISEGPLGHPGDGEYHTWDIIAFRTEVSYAPEGIKVDISGQTTSGIDGFDAGKKLPPKKFEAQFTIPTERFAEFFQLKEHVHTYLMSEFRQLFPLTPG